MLHSVKRHFFWVANVYLMQGLPYALIAAVAPLIFKSMGFENSRIALYTSLFTLPWILKFFIAPALEKIATKRTFTIMMQMLISGFIFLLALALYFSSQTYIYYILFILIAFASSIHDINSDGLYIDKLDTKDQAKLLGVRTFFYQVGRLLCQSGLVIVAGLFLHRFHLLQAWSFVLCLLSIFVLAVTFIDNAILPGKIKNPSVSSSVWQNVKHAYKEVFTQCQQLPYLWNIMFFIFIYNTPESQLIKIVPLFLFDHPQVGGLGMNLQQIGLIYGGIGVGSMLLGVTVGGFLLARLALKTCLIPFTLLLLFSNLMYLLLALHWVSSALAASLCIGVAEFMNGLSNGAYVFFLVQIFAKSTYSMSLFAIGTAVMLFGMLTGGSISGYVQQLLGYQGFFIWVVVSGFVFIGVATYKVHNIIQ